MTSSALVAVKPAWTEKSRTSEQDAGGVATSQPDLTVLAAADLPHQHVIRNRWPIAPRRKAHLARSRRIFDLRRTFYLILRLYDPKLLHEGDSGV